MLIFLEPLPLLAAFCSRFDGEHGDGIEECRACAVCIAVWEDKEAVKKHLESDYAKCFGKFVLVCLPSPCCTKQSLNANLIGNMV